MSVFLLLAAMLLAAVLAALLWPLLRRRDAAAAEQPGAVAASNAAVYRDQLAELDTDLRAGTIGREQWSASRADIERRVLEETARADAAQPARPSRRLAAVVGVVVPLVAIGLYIVLGDPRAFSPDARIDIEAGRGVGPEQIEAMVARLAQRLQKNPGDVQGWMMLGRSLGVLGRYGQAATAYSRAVELRPDDPDLLADYADVLAMAQGRKLAGAPEALVARALALDPNNPKALLLAGSAAFERRDYSRAVRHWEKALALLPDESEVAQSVRASIAEAQQALGPAGSAKPPQRSAEASKAAAPTAGAVLQGKVSLAATMPASIQPEDFVYVFARAAQGPRMPLAVVRRQVKDLPFEFRLDDSMAMNPALTLSSFDKVVVVARISRSGIANPSKGDLEGTTGPIPHAMKGVQVSIDRIVE
jgi:cytochrome c-type biogenesis protein CcmH